MMNTFRPDDIFYVYDRMIGITLDSAVVDKKTHEVRFSCGDRVFVFYLGENASRRVHVGPVTDLAHAIGSPIIEAFCTCEQDEQCNWAQYIYRYHFVTAKGRAEVRWSYENEWSVTSHADYIELKGGEPVLDYSIGDSVVLGRQAHFIEKPVPVFTVTGFKGRNVELLHEERRTTRPMCWVEKVKST